MDNGPTPNGAGPCRKHDSEVVAEFVSRLSAATSAGEFSGAVLVQRHGEIVHSEAYGPRDRETNAPNTTDTCFCVASRGKMLPPWS